MVKHRNKTGRPGAPKRRLGLGVFFGIFIGLGVAIAVTFYVNQATQRIGDNHDVVGSSAQPSQDPVDDEVDFDFYKLLPGKVERQTFLERKEILRAFKEARFIIFRLQHYRMLQKRII